jgi:hypothetical protein
MEGICGSCGLPLATGDEFCGSCGRPSVAGVPVEPAPLAAAPANAEPAAANPMAPDRAGRPARSGWPSRLGGSIPADAAAGQRTPNAEYLGHRLVYDRVPEGSFDPLSNTRLLRQFGLRLLLYIMIYWLGGLVAGIALLILGLAAGFGVAVTLWWVGAVIAGLLFTGLFLLMPVPAQLSEWKFFVDGKASAGPVAFDHIAWALQQRRSPLDVVQVRRLKLAGGEGRDYLEIGRGLFTGFVSCFAYGEDLYLGWTFWLRLSPLHFAFMMIARLWQTLMQRGSELYVSLRYDYARAMREVMHSVAREGVDVAIGQARPQGEGTAGSTMRVVVSDIDA